MKHIIHTILGYLAFFLLVPVIWIVLKAWDLLSDKCDGCKQPLRYTGYEDIWVCDTKGCKYNDLH